jgi:hypothetical protein
MPFFETPSAISIVMELSVGDAWITASERVDTVVEIRPRSATSKADTTMAEQTTVEYAEGQLTIRVPKSWRRYSPLGAGPSVDVMVEVPLDSRLRVEASWSTVRTEGRLGECWFHTGGAVRVQHCGPLTVDTNYGEITALRVVGPAQVKSSSGRIQLDEVTGSVEAKNSNGDCRIGFAAGQIRVNTGNGDIIIGEAASSVNARTTHGGIRIGSVTRGRAELRTAHGPIEVGVSPGTAAWLDLDSKHGRVHSSLDGVDEPSEADETVEIVAGTSYGNILVHRSEMK